MSVHRLYLPVTSCILPVTVRHHSHPQQSRTILHRILCLLPPATFHCIFTHEHNINNIHFYIFPTVPQIFTGVNHHVKIPIIMFISLPNTAGRWGHARHCRNSLPELFQLPNSIKITTGKGLNILQPKSLPNPLPELFFS